LEAAFADAGVNEVEVEFAFLPTAIRLPDFAVRIGTGDFEQVRQLRGPGVLRVRAQKSRDAKKSRRAHKLSAIRFHFDALPSFIKPIKSFAPRSPKR
jgi:hypothetical protein